MHLTNTGQVEMKVRNFLKTTTAWASIALLLFAMGCAGDSADQDVNGDAVGSGDKTLFEVIESTPALSTLKDAIVAAQLDGTLSGEGPFTVLAPANTAFDALPEGTLADLLANPEALTSLLVGHVAGVELQSGDLEDGGIITTLGQTNLPVVIADGQVTIGGATVQAADIQATNGVLHIIGSVIVDGGAGPGEPTCGDGACDETEDAASCPADCDSSVPSCGDGDCNGDENIESCPEDCTQSAAECGNAVCEEGEDEASCPADCEAAAYDPATCCEWTGDPTCTYQPCLDAVAEFDSFCSDNFDEFCTNCANGGLGYDDVDCASISDACMCDAEPALGNIIEVATEAGIFTTLLAAVDAAGLTDTLANDGPFTVFAPTDDAFAALPEGTIDALLENLDALTVILLYHVVDGVVPAEDVVALEEAMTLAGFAVKITVTDEGVMLNDSVMVTATDVFASNGVIHIVDAVLLPPEAPEEVCGDGTCGEGEDVESCPQDCDPELGNIIEVATEAGVFTTLLAAVDAAGLTDTLANDGPFTVFAPTDDAFAALPEGTVEALLENIEALTGILLYHVVEGIVPAADVVALEEAMTLAGVAISITVTDDGVMLNDSVMVTTTDVFASNGVIHIIDAVLLPPEAPEEICGDAVCGEGEDEANCPADCTPELGNIIEVATEAGVFTTLLAAVDAAGLTDTLANDGPFTVFAPTDDAFAALPEGTIDALLENIDALTEILLYHVANGGIGPAELPTLEAVTTLTNLDITVEATESGIVLNGVVNVTGGAPASNGVIHIIDAVLLPDDAPEVVCEEGEVVDCNNTCTPGGWVGDNICDETLNCADFDNDGGDCCPQGTHFGCDGETCIPDDIISNGECDEEANCEQEAFDGGDCEAVCPEGEIVDCDNTCTQADWIDDGFCDAKLNCEDFEYDGGDCCPEGSSFGCDGETCVDDALVGDGNCDENLNCEARGFDGNDCEASCPEGQVVNCDNGCTTADWLGDNYCDAALDCEALEFDAGDCVEGLGNIIEVAEAAGNFTTLLAAVEAADLTDALSEGGPFTVFAPTDAAFAALPEGTVEALLEDIDQLTDILLYHVVLGGVDAADVIELTEIEMANELTVSITVTDEGVFLNDTIKIEVTDIPASNGVIHVIDAVLLPPVQVCGDGTCGPSEDLNSCPEDCPYDPATCCDGATLGCAYQPCIDAVAELDPFCGGNFDEFCASCAGGNEGYEGLDCSGISDVCECPVDEPVCGDGICAEGEDCPEDCEAPLGDIIEVAEANGNFTTLLTAIEVAGLTETLKSEGPFTVFAPLDSAFDAVPADILNGLLGDITALTEVLLYHVVAGAVPAEVVVTLDSAETLQGQSVTITVTDAGEVFLNDTVKVVLTDVPASNGIIHVIDAVLLPAAPGPVCGDGVCEDGEECPADCQIEVICGDGVCGPGETVEGCWADCIGADGELFGDCVYGTCTEEFNACDADEGCQAGVTCFKSCFEQGGSPCGSTCAPGGASNGSYYAWLGCFIAEVNQPDKAEFCINPPESCGDGACTYNEQQDGSCPADCGSAPVCGDGVCEDGENCDADCVTPPVCGDGVCEAGESCDADCLGDIIEVATQDGNFTTLLAAVEAAGLTETLKGDGPFTVFAPIDSAFDALPEGTLESLLADIPALTDILLYHVVAGEVPASTVITLDSAETLGGEVTITVTDAGDVFLNDTVKVILTDVKASNGIIHVIDAVLIPSAPSPVCGDGVCESGEDVSSCWADCINDGKLQQCVGDACNSEFVACGDDAGCLDGVTCFKTCWTNGGNPCGGTCAPTDGVSAGLYFAWLNCFNGQVNLPGNGSCINAAESCGDGACTYNENVNGSCPADCDGVPLCGDGVCEDGEDCDADCVVPPVCGDGVCEDGENCDADCVVPPVCGDGVCEDGEDCEADCLGNIIEVATAAGDFETLLAVLEIAELTDTLATGGDFTVFAPTDAAFEAVPEAALNVLLNDIDQLTNVLLYHVVEGIVPASVVVTVTETGTLQGGEIAIDINDAGEVILNGTVKVVVTDIKASNGIIHVIDAVLLPGALCGDEVCTEGEETAESCFGDCALVGSLPDCLLPECQAQVTTCFEDPACAAAYVCLKECVETGGNGCTSTCQPQGGNQNLVALGQCGGQQGCGNPPEVCGDGACTFNEDIENCPEDCTPPEVCGDGACTESENSNNCPEDCGAPPACGDGTCDPGENVNSCPGDCPYDPSSCCEFDGDDGACIFDACVAAVSTLDPYCADSFDSACVSCANAGEGYQGLDCSAIANSCGCNPPPEGCEEVITNSEYGTFLFCDIDQNWENAEATCKDLGGELASFHSAAEMNLVNDVVSAEYWFGANDRADEGNWSNSDGSAYDYTNWGPGEPNNFGNFFGFGGEDCAEVYPSGVWNDGDCEDAQAFMCKFANLVPPAGNIVEELDREGSFTTLIGLVEAAGLVDTLTSPGPFTVFAPTDDAFAAVPANILEALGNNIDELTDVLLYHVASGNLDSNAVVGLDSLVMAQEGIVNIEVTDSGVVLNGQVSITVVDIEASNGIIHVIDAVLLPEKNIPGTLARLGEFTTLLDLVTQAELAETLSSDGPWTVFAPTDAAFEAVPSGVLLDLLADDALLTNVLLYHVATTELQSTEVVSGNYVTSASGLGINVNVDGSTVQLNTATVTTVDVNATNGVIHIIDAVLLPLDATECCEFDDNPSCADNQCIATVGEIDEYCVESSFDAFCAQCARGESYTVQGASYDCSEVGNACGCNP